MYESFFGLNERPFALRPDPEFLFLSQTHRAALSMLDYAFLSQPGIALVTGDTGTGKTILVRKLLEVENKDLTVGLVNNTQIDSHEELLQWILFAFGLEYRNQTKVELFQTLVEFLIEEANQERKVILVVDEAQGLNVALLEQLRQLTNVNVDKDELIQLVLVGNTQLRRTLQQPFLSQLTSTVAIDCHINSLTEDETKEYIAFRIEMAGGDPNLFDIQSYMSAYGSTNGVPRSINLLCDTALLFAFADQVEQVDVTIMQEAAKSREEGLGSGEMNAKRLN